MATIQTYQSSGSGIYARFPRLSGFTILEQLHEGSHNTIYRARQDRLGRQVVLKLLPEWPPPTDVALERFNRAAFVSAQVPNPNLVTLYDTGTRDGFHFVSLEYVQGQTLQRYMTETGVLDERFAIFVAAQLLNALAALHERDICHRNLKPKNIFLEPDGKVRLMGLGLSSCKNAFFSPHLDARVIGTPHFMAPEMVRGSYSEPRSDLYALGISLFVACTGQPPFEKGPPAAVMARHLTDTPLMLRDLRPDLSRDFTSFVHKLMAQELEQRFGSAREALITCEALMARSRNLPPPVPRAKGEPPPLPRSMASSSARMLDVAHLLGLAAPKRLHPALVAGISAVLTVCFIFGAMWFAGHFKSQPSASPPPAQLIPSTAIETDESVAFSKLEQLESSFLSNPVSGRDAWSDFLQKYPHAPASQRAAAKAKLELYLMLIDKENARGHRSNSDNLEF